jgi:Domain of unknown function (DUF1905)/Bacteriocin-protection, YdeI or OmpD-Associated
MISFSARIQKFGDDNPNADRSVFGWAYIEIPTEVTDALMPGKKTSFRVKGRLDNYAIQQVALLPMGRIAETPGAFMIPINAQMRRGTGKDAGATLQVELAFDDSPLPQSADLLACLNDDPAAMAYFETLAKGHQNYFSKWIESAKTIETKTKRITQAVTALAMGMGYGEMIRYFKKHETPG